MDNERLIFLIGCIGSLLLSVSAMYLPKLIEFIRYGRTSNFVRKDTAPERSYDTYVNAVAILLGIPWEDAYTLLADSGKKLKLVSNSKWNVFHYLHGVGFPFYSETSYGKFSGKPLTCRAFAKKFDKGTYLLFSHNFNMNCCDWRGDEITVVRDGVMYGLLDKSSHYVSCVCHGADMISAFNEQSKHFDIIGLDSDEKYPYKTKTENND